LSHIETLRSLESLLVSFLERAVALKEDRLCVLDGINRLDDIAQGVFNGDDLTDQIGDWFAEHNHWLEDSRLKTADYNRMGKIFGQIKREIHASQDSSPAVMKISDEIDRWTEKASHRKLVLKRGPEVAQAKEADNTIALFGNMLNRIDDLFADLSGSGKHLLSVLDQTLKTASLQKSNEALLLSALIIYYLKLSNYMVEPYIRRLKEAESLQKGGG